ncbi:dTDP-4-dehydrorhamnose 3,5-epimerase [Halomicronema hongdechloris C2206]|uniref:dTDP-4-dehydrorhamnose 3,5-epimerase n=1 Tax=Halomicronema hongdechloris C2206 TaxID=1641165 RepID=A0A1Z3HPB8_9CYAN|nr:dTDP-4-dehydrorhamnose 3,5-epimerase [Halomicronema hongdechloris]ASC72106.1 dTDP-4-dehydrorhamnose 3,5-epimerase [Halomicronema hongdechloris C2206]
MNCWESKIPGCYEIQLRVFQDHRGKFVKTFHQGIFEDQNLETQFSETYYSISSKNVLRGLHFQVPPKDHVKLVHCLQGEILDAVVDLRVGAPTYGQYETFHLTEDKGNSVYIPAGLAHGFYILSEQAVVIYQVSTVYAPQYEQGILWDSANIPWPTDNPNISGKDSNWKSLSEFKSPFVYNAPSFV